MSFHKRSALTFLGEEAAIIKHKNAIIQVYVY